MQSPETQYITQVLGLEDLIATTGAVQLVAPVEVARVKFYLHPEEAKDVQAVSMLKKMGEAMGLSEIEYQVNNIEQLEVDESHSTKVIFSSYVPECLNSAKWGELEKNNESSVLVTHPFKVLLKDVSKKKDTWSHLQEVMKCL